MPKNWDECLPDVSDWQPQTKNDNTLKRALEITCQLAQDRIISRSKAEIHFNIHNWDSGSGVEDIVREELANLLPQRYCVEAGVVNDRHGNTAEDCDLLIRDRIWSPVIKHGATNVSRRSHYPIEGVYSATEIKQTLGLDELDAAMKKLVTLSRLDRPDNPYGHITENQHLGALDQPGAILNPLHTSVFAIRLQSDATFNDIAHRFGRINAMLTRDHMVKTLCVLGHGTAWYSVPGSSSYGATHMKDRDQVLVMELNDGEPDNAFYRFYILLLGHLTRSVLGIADMAAGYGNPPPRREVVNYGEAVFNRDVR